MNTDLQNLKLHFLRLVSNAVFIKNIENVKKKNKDIKLNETKTRNVLVSEQNYDTTKFFPENLLATQMKKTTEILMNKPDCLGLKY